MKILRFGFLLVFTLLHFSVAAQQVMFVQSAKANVMAEPGFDSQLVIVLQKGDTVTLVKEQGRWAQVTHESQSGWIAKLLLANQPPIDTVSVLKGKQEQLENSARRRASTNVTAAATRGLRSEDRARISDEGQPDYNELLEMEAVKVEEAEVMEFHEEGLSQ